MHSAYWGSARVSRVGFGAAPKQLLPEFGTFLDRPSKEKFVIARTRSPARVTRALSTRGATGRFGKMRSRTSAETGRARFRRFENAE